MSIPSSPATFNAVFTPGQPLQPVTVTFAIPGGNCAQYLQGTWEIQGSYSPVIQPPKNDLTIATGAGYADSLDLNGLPGTPFDVMIPVTSAQLADINAAAGGNLSVQVTAFPLTSRPPFTVSVTSFTLTLSSCVISLSPTSANYTSAGGSGSFSVTTSSPSCPWAANAQQSWLHTSSSGTGNGAVNYTVDANAGVARVGTILVCDKVFTVSEGGAAPILTGPDGSTQAGIYQLVPMSGNQNGIYFHLLFPNGYVPAVNLYSLVGRPVVASFGKASPKGYVLTTVTNGVLALIDPVLGVELNAGDTRVAGCEVWLLEEGTQ